MFFSLGGGGGCLLKENVVFFSFVCFYKEYHFVYLL